MDGLDIASKRLAKEEELTPVEESILEQHTIHSKKNHLVSVVTTTALDSPSKNAIILSGGNHYGQKKKLQLE